MIDDIEGLVAADVAILFFYGEHRLRISAPPATVAQNTPVSSSHANRRCKQLAKGGLLELEDERGYYRITQLGLRYLNGGDVEEEVLANFEASDP